MSTIRAREAKKLQQSLKAHSATKAIEHEAWQILHEKGVDAALEYLAEAACPEQLLENAGPFQNKAQGSNLSRFVLANNPLIHFSR